MPMTILRDLDLIHKYHKPPRMKHRRKHKRNRHNPKHKEEINHRVIWEEYTKTKRMKTRKKDRNDHTRSSMPRI